MKHSETANNDRQEISDLVLAYAYAVDARDWETFASLWHEDAEVDYRSAGGISGSSRDFVAWLPGALEMFEWTLHSVMSHRVRFTSDDTAEGEAHVIAHHGLTWEGRPEWLDVIGIYRDRYVRTPDGWRFLFRSEDTRQFRGGALAELLNNQLGQTVGE